MDSKHEFEENVGSNECAPDDEFEAFDWNFYGAWIKSQRKKAGYTTAQAFSDTVWRRTRVRVSRDSIYKIEQGRQIPDGMQFMAINMALFNNPFPHDMLRLACDEWNLSVSNGPQPLIPEGWRYDNTMATGEETALEAAYVAQDKAYLFCDRDLGAEQVWEDERPAQ